MKLYKIKKFLIGILIISGIYACNKVGFANYFPEDNLYGTWELTRYKKDGVDLISSSNFTRTDLNIKDGDNIYGKFYSHSNGTYCNDSILFFKIDVDLKSNSMKFEKTGICNFQDVIDPLYFKNGTEIENEWHIKNFSKKLFILSNNKTDRDVKIELMFEKSKDL